ncbi:type II toxin-antitoxin system VapC family toxin [Inquilinus limosus]|uniref:type II toxin-antitoxin system VapC family toxin n=1 Tax=Inquilinus limosus TaxID=171674 RepID=UPI003F164606
MRLLLDTHVAIWALVSPDVMPESIRALIADPANAVHISAASIWEIAIKHSMARRSAPPFSGAQAIGYFEQAGYALLPVSAEHAAGVEVLPPLHADPFDRLLVAQALAEPLRLITHDDAVAAYDGSIIHF